jgi:hypothetical protein
VKSLKNRFMSSKISSVLASGMSPVLFSGLVLSIIASGVACSPPSSPIMGRVDIKTQRPADEVPTILPDVLVDAKDDVEPVVVVEKPEWILEDGGSQDVVKGKVDILFTIDDSESMNSSIQNLSRNIGRFVDRFGQNKLVDFQVATTSVWDSKERFTSKTKFQKGELRKAKAPSGKTADVRYVSRVKGFAEILAATLKLGIVPFDQGGPENEEMFSPMIEALKLSAPGGINAGFLRPDAHLISVIVSDAEDSSPDMTPKQAADALIAFKGGKSELVSAYFVGLTAADPDDIKDPILRVRNRAECKDSNGKIIKTGQCAIGFGPDKIEDFIVHANSHPDENGKVLTAAQIKQKHIMKLNQPDFGDDLARIGSDIATKVLEKVIALKRLPAIDKATGELLLRVRYGTLENLEKSKAMDDKTASKFVQIIPQSADGGWTYDPGRNQKSIRVSGQFPYKDISGGRIGVIMQGVRI